MRAVEGKKLTRTPAPVRSVGRGFFLERDGPPIPPYLRDVVTHKDASARAHDGIAVYAGDALVDRDFMFSIPHQRFCKIALKTHVVWSRGSALR